MPISDNEYNSLIGRLRERTQEYVDRYGVSGNTTLGNIGEKFVGYCICHSLWRLGYTISFHNRPHSYLLTLKYGANEEGVGGIDFKLVIVNLDERRYRFLIETKNWGDHYPITADMFSTEILDRFTRIDTNREYVWVITMNTRNIEGIQPRCENNNIHILPIEHQITPDNISDNAIMRPVFNNFIENFIAQMMTLAPESSYPDITIDESRRNRTQYVMRDLFLNVPYPIIQHRYEVSRRYIIRLATYIRSFHYPLPDRRRKNWRLQWEIQD